MATFKWLGGLGTIDPNDATQGVNWLIQQGGSFVAAGSTPSAGDLVLIPGVPADSGTLDLASTSGNRITLDSQTVIDLTGAGETLNFSGVTLASGALVEQTGTGGDTLNLSAGAAPSVNAGQIAAVGAGVTLTVNLTGTSTTAPGLTNTGQLFAALGGTLVVNGGTNAALANYGAILAYGGTVKLAAAEVNVTGNILVGSGTLNVAGGVGSAQTLLFLDAAGVIRIETGFGLGFNPRVAGMQAGDKIDLVGIPLVGTSQTIVNGNTLEISNAGTVLANLRFNGAGFTLASFQALASDGAGGVLVQTAATVLDPIWNFTSGDFGTAADWTTLSVPGTADTALITTQNAGAYSVAISTPQSVATLITGSTNATVLVQSTLTANTVYDSAGTFDVVSGGKINANVFQQTGSGGVLLLEPGSSMVLRGGNPSASNNGYPGLDIENTGTINNATYSAAFGVNKGGNSYVGATGIGSLLVENGSTVTDTYAELGNFNQGSGSLTITGAATRWTDAGGDASGAGFEYNGGMLVGGGGFASATNSLSTGGLGKLLVDQGAILTEANFGLVGYTRLSDGTVSIANAAHWNIGTGVNAAPTLTPSGTAAIPTLTLGYFGNAVLNVTSGGTVTLGGAQTLNTYKLAVGYAASSGSDAVGQGALTVSGTGSKVDTGGGVLVVGQHGTGTVSVLAGGTILVGSGGAGSGFSFGAMIGSRDQTTGGNPGFGTGLGVGALTIDGAGSLFSDSSSFVDGRDGLGQVVVRNGGSLAVTGSVLIGGSGVAGLGGGVMVVSGGGRVTATGLHLFSAATTNAPGGDQLTIDAASFMEIGTLGTGGAGALTVDAGFTADGAGSITGNLHLAGLLAASGGTLTLAGGTITGGGTLGITGAAVLNVAAAGSFSTPVVFTGSGGTLRLQAAGADQGSIRGMVIGDTIDLRGVAFSGQTVGYDGSHLTFGGASFDVGLVAGGFTAQADGSGGSQLVEVACFLAGSRILTARGEVAVEALAVGDRVATLHGGLRPLRWIGRTRIDLDRHARPERATPIRVLAGAFAPGMPHRDLFLSGDHAIHVDGALIPVHLLVNGQTVARQPAAGVVEYFHLELDAHDVLLAEGLPAESYLDTGNRTVFTQQDTRMLHPDLTTRPTHDARQWDEAACAVLLLGGPRVAAENRRLRDRAAALGHRLTSDAAPWLEADGVPLAMLAGPDGLLRVTVPAAVRSLRLRSRRAIPQEVDPGGSDRRVLGVAVAELRCNGAELAMDDACMDGFHPLERDGTTQWRWTDGDAGLRVPGGGQLELRLLPGWCRYPAVDQPGLEGAVAQRA